MSKLFIVSLGPGRLDWLTPNAQLALEKSQHWVGYAYYLDLLKAWSEGKCLHAKALGEEVERARLALNLAAQGETTALVASGDAGIYAMASVLFETLDQGLQQDANADWNYIDIEVIPGVSAMQAVSSSIGALLGHDFCTISLSDLLTPWEKIAKRIRSAAEADFVICFYNPKSKTRDWQLPWAIECLKQYRASETLVIIARQVTRDQESICHTRLADFDANQVDMFTLVAIGNTQTRAFQQGEKTWLYTPRGYEVLC